MSEINAAAAGTIKVGDFTVNRMGFGAMRLTGEGVWGEPKDHKLAIEVLKEAVVSGVNFIDTADAYGPKVSEDIIHEALAPYDGLVIATKGGKLRPGPGVWHDDCSAAHLREAIGGSLKRLGVKRIDLYQLHAVDIKVSFHDSLQTLIGLKKEGKIRHIGISNVAPENLAEALTMTEIVSVQNRYNVLERDSEEVLKLCEANKIAFIPYFPLGGGRWAEGNETLKNVAKKHQATVSQIALAWLLAKSKFMLPIPGTSSLDHLHENIAAASIKLDPVDLDQLNSLA